MAGPSAQPAAPHDRALPPNHGPIQADLTFTHREAEDSWRQTLGVFALATLLVASALVPPTQPASAETTLGSEITVGARPIGIALNPATNRVYVTNVEGGSVSVIDSETEAVVGAPIQTSAQPALVAVNPTTNRVYVTHPTANAVTVIDGATNTVIGSPVAVGMSPIGVAVNSLTNRVYVANNQSGSVTVLDGATNAMIGTPIIFLVDPQVVAVNPVTNRAYVASYQNGLIYVIDGATNTLMGPPIGVRERPVGIAVNTVTNRIFVANSKTNDVTVIDGATNTVVAASIPVGLTPAFLDVNVSTNRVYVATYGSSAVTVINGANHGIIGPPIPVGLNPEGVALHPGTNRVYVTNINSGTVSVVGVPFSTSTDTANSGGTLSATWSGLYGPSGSNYVGLFEVGAKQIATPLSQVFTNGTASSGGPGLPAGSVKLPIPPSLPAGRYEVRLVAGPTGGTLARAGLTVVNEVPVAKDDTYTVNHGSVLTVPAPGVLANDVDADSPSLQATVVTAPTNGTLNLQPNGAFTYTPRPSFAGTDRFTYRASDETSQSATGTVTITVAPVACGPRPTVRTSTAVANGALQVTVNVSDVDGPTHNRLKELRFGSPVNGRIELAGQSQTAAFTHTVPAATDRVSFAVRRVSPGQPTTVPLTVVDECGTWPTLVGGGTGAGF